MTIKTYAQLLSVLTTMAANLPDFATDLATTPADQTFLDNSLANLQYLQNYVEVYDDNKKAYTAIKQRAYNGAAGAIPDGPATDAFNPPFPLIGDVHGNLMLLIGRIESASKYSVDPIGIALGIAGGGGEALDPATVKPTLDAHAAQTGFLYSVVIGNRAESQSWELEYRTKGGQWTSAGVFTGKSADITFASPDNDPAVLELRVQLKKNNANYGLLSDVVTITVNP